mmetsp:Transcript_9699/g.29139  ORF Transcript_9699/g.29139 Transcript_9699/m.29139 type:complete len:325 (-) Transcript_9699:433-1407(-)
MLRDRGPVWPCRCSGTWGHGDGSRQEQGDEGSGLPRPRLLRQAAGDDLQGLRGPRRGGRHQGDGRGRDPAGADGLHVGEEAGHGAQARQLHLLHLGRPRRGAEVLRGEHLRGVQPGAGPRRRAVPPLVPEAAAEGVHQVHRDDPDGHRGPRPGGQRRPQHHRHGARGQGPGVRPLQRPADHRPPLRRGAGRRREDVRGRVRQRRERQGLHREDEEDQPADHGNRAPHQVPGEPRPAGRDHQGLRQEALQGHPHSGLCAGRRAADDEEAGEPDPQRRRLHRRVLCGHDPLLRRLLAGGVRRPDGVWHPERPLRSGPLHRLHRPLP